MAAIKPLDQISAKWASVTPQRAPQYAEGVQSPRVDWADATKAAADNWAAGVTAAVQSKSFGKGVEKSGTERWKRMTLAKGTSRWGEGIQLAQADFQNGYAPYREAIANLNLPPRFARRDPRNLERIRSIVQAMIATKQRIG